MDDRYLKVNKEELIKLYRKELEKLSKEIERYKLQIKALQSNLEFLLAQKKWFEKTLKEIQGEDENL